MLSAVDDMVQVQNNGSERTIEYNRRPWKLPTGKKVMVPAGCAFLYFGDPRSQEKMQSLRRIPDDDSTVEFVPDRATEVRRLRHFYGAGFGDEASFDGVEAVPAVQMFDMEGNEITTVLQDPAGETTNSAVTSKRDQSDLLSLVQRQQRQIDALHEALQMPSSARDETELPTDDTFNDTPGGPPPDDPAPTRTATSLGGEVEFNDPTFADPNAP